MNNYIVLEGVKGVGKSTIFQLLSNYLYKHKVRFSEVCPTKRQNQDNSFWELMYGICQSEFVKEQVYAHRSNFAAQSADWNSPLVIGDRSIITSYVSRFCKYTNPSIQIQRVDMLEPIIKSPRLVLYLHADIECILKRLSARKNRTYGKEDEVASKVLRDLSAYDELRKKSWADRIRNTHWIDIDCSESINDVFEQVLVEIKECIDSC